MILSWLSLYLRNNFAYINLVGVLQIKLSEILWTFCMVCINPINYVLDLGLDNGTIKTNFAEPHFLSHADSGGQLYSNYYL